MTPAVPAAAYFGLVVATLAVSCSAILIRSAESSPLTIATYRMLFAVALLAPTLLLTQRSRLAWPPRSDLWSLVASGMCLAAHFGLWTASLAYTSVSSSVVLVNTHPLFIAAAEVILFHRRLPAVVWVGIALTLVGGLVIGYGDLQVTGQALVGDLLAVGGAIAMVGYLLIGRYLRQRQGFLTYSVSVYVVCGLALGFAALALDGSLAVAHTNDWMVFLGLAAVSTVCGHTVFNWTLRHLPASVVATSFVGEPVAASALAWLVFGESPNALAFIGGIPILVGIYLTARYGA